MLVFLGLSPVTFGAGEAKDPVVLGVGNTKFTASQVGKFIGAMPQQFRPFYSGAGKSKLAELLVTTELLVREAKKRHVETQPDVQIQIKIATDSILSNAAKIELGKEMKVTDAELKKYLDNS